MDKNTETDDDALFALYNQELLRLSARVAEPKILNHPDASARAISPVCGSVVDVAITVKDGKVTDFGYAVEACALTKTVVSIVKDAIIGTTREDIAKAGQYLHALLAGQESPLLPSPALSPAWEKLSILAPVHVYKARHNALQLPFEALEKAFLLL